MKMLNLNSFAKLGLFIYIIIYIIFPKLAITKNTKVDIRENLENGLNTRNLKLIKNNFIEEKSNLKIQGKFEEIINDFPNARWEINRLNEGNYKERIFDIKVNGTKIVNGVTYVNIYFLLITIK